MPETKIAEPVIEEATVESNQLKSVQSRLLKPDSEPITEKKPISKLFR